MTKTSVEEIENYIDNEVKEGRVQIGFEDVNGEVSEHIYIFKRMVSGFMLIKSQFSDRVTHEPVFCVNEYNDTQYRINDSEEIIGTISCPCHAVFCLVPDHVSFAKVKKPHDMKTVLLGYELPNQEHPDWIKEFKKEYVKSFGVEKFIEEMP